MHQLGVYATLQTSDYIKIIPENKTKFNRHPLWQLNQDRITRGRGDGVAY